MSDLDLDAGPAEEEEPEAFVFTLSVSGMTCAACVGRVERALYALNGVDQVTVNLLTGRASVAVLSAIPNASPIASLNNTSPGASNHGNDSTTADLVLDVLEDGGASPGLDAPGCETKSMASPMHSDAELLRALTSAGYGGTLLEQHQTGGAHGHDGKHGSASSRVTYRVDGMVCEACPERIRRRMRLVPGVQRTIIDEQKSTVTVVWDALRDHIGVRTFMQLIGELDYECTVDDTNAAADRAGAAQRAAEIRSNKRSFLVAAAFTLPIVIIMMVLSHTPLKTDLMHNLLEEEEQRDEMDGMDGGHGHGHGGGGGPELTIMALLGWLLATPVQFGVGYRYYAGAYKTLSHGGANMDVLIALGTSTAYFYSMAAVISSMAQGSEGSVELEGGAHFFETVS